MTKVSQDLVDAIRSKGASWTSTESFMHSFDNYIGLAAHDGLAEFWGEGTMEMFQAEGSTGDNYPNASDPVGWPYRHDDNSGR